MTPFRVDAPPVRGDELVQEHRALVRQLAGLQHRCTSMLQAAAMRQLALDAENLRLRAELVIWRSGVSWGLGATAMARARPNRLPVRPDTPIDPEAREAQAVICQTGCVGHAHPWLASDGQCRRSGDACERLAAVETKR